jgi:TRAP-type C4-dicarboxylate transport system permease small subunit
MGTKIENVVTKVTLVIGSAAFSGMVILISVNVISRYFFGRSFAWAEEITYLCFNWAVFLGVTVLYKNASLITVDMLVDLFPKKIQKATAIFNYSLLTLICGAMTVWGFTHAIRGIPRRTTAIGISYFFYNMAIPVAMIIMVAYSIKFLVMIFRDGKLPVAVQEY